MSNLTSNYGGNQTSNLTSIYGGNQTLINNPNLCTLQTCDLTLASLNYIPTLAGNAAYGAILAVLLAIQVGLGIRYKIWGFMIAMCLGLTLEVGGYAGRILMSRNPFNNNDFLIYLVLLTIAPALLTAAIYLCLARIVIVYGEGLSRFRPRTYTLIFCACDLLSLILQALGGAIASTSNTVSGKNLGKNIMVGGLAFQVASLTLFAICCTEFGLRVRQNRNYWNPNFHGLVNSLKFKLFLWSLGIAVLTIFTRSVFRCAELSGGFNGKLFNDQITFMILEGPMIIMACTALTLFHPGIAFQGHWHDANFSYRPFPWTKKHPHFNMKTLSDEQSIASRSSHGEPVELIVREYSRLPAGRPPST